MVEIGNSVVIVGLFIDVVGAAVIALPDIPQLKQYHKAGRMENSLQILTIGAIPAAGKGFNELSELMEDIYDEPLPDDTQGLIVKADTLSNTLWRKIYIEDDNNNERVWGDIPFEVVRLRLETDIRKREACIRAVGFLTLSVGFVLQMAAAIW